MKKSEQDGPDISELVIKMQQQIDSLEKKIDTLINRPAQRPPEPKPFFKPYQQQSANQSYGGPRQDNNYSQRVERTMHKAVCADCHKECEVPFKPKEDRPVYCKDCFSAHKAGRPDRDRPVKAHTDNKPREPFFAKVVHGDKERYGKNRKFAGKRKPAIKKRKK